MLLHLQISLILYLCSLKTGITITTGTSEYFARFKGEHLAHAQTSQSTPIISPKGEDLRDI